MTKSNPSRLMLVLAYFAIYFIWGTTYMANLFGLEGMKPFVLSCLRYVIAGVLLTVFCMVKRETWPPLSSLKVSAISGIVMLVGGSGLVVYSEQYISSGYAAVIIATEPLWFVLLDKKRWPEYFSNRKILTGLLTGFVGIALFAHFTPGSSAVGTESSMKFIATLIVLLSAIFWVLGTLYSKSRTQQGSSNFANTAIQLIAAGIFSGLLAIPTGEWAQFHPVEITARAWGGLVFLVFLGSLAAYLAFTWLVTVQPPALVSTHTYVNPVVALFIGWLVANEPVSVTQVFALVIVLIGVILTTTSKEKLAIEAA